MIDKDCYIRKTEFKIFGIKIAEQVITYDNTIFSEPDETSFYAVPECFRRVKHDK